MKIQDYIKSLSRKEATRFRQQIAREFGISASYSRHLCNGWRKIPAKNAFKIERLTGGAVTRFDIAPDEYPQFN